MSGHDPTVAGTALEDRPESAAAGRARRARPRMSPFDVCNYAFFIVLCFVMTYPLWYSVMASFMTEGEYLATRFILYPRRPTVDAYRKIFTHGEILARIRVTVFITVVGTGVSLFITSYAAYGFSKRFPGSKVLLYFVVATMFVYPGLIPVYLNLRNLGLINTLAVYILPSAISTFYLIIMRNHYLDFPAELEESARMDGCNEFGIYFRVVLPLSKAVLAAIGLFFAVQYWNTYMQSVFFITDPDKKTVQEYLRDLVIETTDIEMIMVQLEAQSDMLSVDTIRLANVVLVLIPILLVYPFLQKYFVKGLMIGAIKG